MTFTINTHDPCYQQDGGIKGLELVQDTDGAKGQRLDWFAFS